MQSDDDSWGAMSEANQRQFAAAERERQERLVADEAAERRRQREEARFVEQTILERELQARRAVSGRASQRHRPATPRLSAGAGVGTLGLLVAFAGIGWVVTRVEGPVENRKNDDGQLGGLKGGRTTVPPIVAPILTLTTTREENQDERKGESRDVGPKPVRAPDPEPDPEPRPQKSHREPPPIQLQPPKPTVLPPPTPEPFAEFHAKLAAATSELDAGQFDVAKSSLEVLERTVDAMARREEAARPVLALIRFRLAEALRGRGLAAATRSRNDETAAKLLHNAARAFAALEGAPDQGNARDGTSLRASALRWRAEIHARLHVGYRELSRRSPGVSAYRGKLREHQKAAEACVERLQANHGEACLADGRRVVDVVRDEIRTLTH